MTKDEQKKIFAKNLANQINKSGKQQKEIAKDLCIPYTTFNTWRRGTSIPDVSVIQHIADYFGILKTDLLDDKTDETNRVGMTFIPVYGTVCAGNGIIAYEDIEDYLVSERGWSKDDHFALTVKGDSMTPRICPNDFVIVHKQDYAEDNDVVIALVDDSAVCKRFKKFQGGIMLVSDNTAYAPMIFSESDLESGKVHLLGKVMELRAMI